MNNAKSALIGVGLAMIIFYIALITVIKSISETLFDLFTDFGFLITGLVLLFLGFMELED